MKRAFELPSVGVLVLCMAMSCEGAVAVAPIEHSGPVTIPPDKSWLACHRDSQCTATALSCHGWIAVNRRHEMDEQRWYSRENADILSVVECAGPVSPKPSAVCRQNACQLE